MMAARLRELRVPAAEAVGSSTVSPWAPAPVPTEKLSVPALHVSPLNEDPLRPSSHLSIWRPATIGTWWAWADAINASSCGVPNALRNDDNTNAAVMSRVRPLSVRQLFRLSP